MPSNVQRPSRIPPITGSDVFTFLFLALFVVIGVSVFITVTASEGFNPFICIWALMFVGVPCLIGYSMFGRFIRYGKFAKDGEALKGKVVRHIDDNSIRVNGAPVKDLGVRYWDSAKNRAIDVEVDVNVLNAEIYPIGSTVWLYKLGEDYAIASKGFDETLPREQELMSSPVYQDVSSYGDASGAGTLHGVNCPCCGSRILIDERWRPVGVDAEAGDEVIG